MRRDRAMSHASTRVLPRDFRCARGYPARLKPCVGLRLAKRGELETQMRTLLALVLVVYSAAALAQGTAPSPGTAPAASNPPSFGGKPLVQVKPRTVAAKPKATPKPQSPAASLQGSWAAPRAGRRATWSAAAGHPGRRPIADRSGAHRARQCEGARYSREYRRRNNKLLPGLTINHGPSALFQRPRQQYPSRNRHCLPRQPARAGVRSGDPSRRGCGRSPASF